MPKSKKHNLTEEYTEEVCEQIRWKTVRPNISKEIGNHIEDQKYANLLNGMEEEEAERRAVESMGDPGLVGKALNKIHRPKMEWSIFLFMIIMTFVGFVVQLEVIRNTEFLYRADWYVSRICFFAIGLSVFGIAYFYGNKLISKYCYLLYGIYVAVFVGVAVFGVRYRGKVLLGYYLMLLFFPLFAGLMAQLRGKKYLGLILAITMYGPIQLLLIYVDAGAVVLELVVGITVLLNIAVLKNWFCVKRWKGLLAANTPLFLFSMYVITSLFQAEYKMQRFKSVFSALIGLNVDTNNSINSTAYMINEQLKGSKLVGTASAVNMSVLNSVTEWKSDFLISFVIIKYGYLFGILLICGLIILLVRMFLAIRRIQNQADYMTALACTLVLTMQSAFYIIGNLHVSLIGTVTLPFLSYGGTSLVVNMSIVGLMLSLYRIKESRTVQSGILMGTYKKTGD